jgi:RNA polymerase sigma-70 factor (ECF subfamily)
MDDAAENADLVRRIAARDPEAREAEAELCRRFAPRARLYGCKHLRNADRAADLAQGVILAVLEAARANRIEDPGRLDRFVLGTCRNIAQRMRETDWRMQSTEAAGLDVLSVAMPNHDMLDAGALYRCFRGLDPRHRAVIFLSFNDEKSAEEISRVIETTPGNVRVLRHRAVAQLRRCLDDCAEEHAR